MTNRRIDIEINLIGGRKAEEGLKRIELAGGRVGESFGGVSDAVKKSGAEVKKEFTAVGESSSGVSKQVGQMAKSTELSLGMMAASIGAVITSFMGLYNALRKYNKEVIAAEIAAEAYKASLSEMTQIIEQLSDAEVTLTQKQVRRLRELSRASQEPIEAAEYMLELNKDRIRSLTEINFEIKRGRELQAHYDRGEEESMAQMSERARLTGAMLQMRLDMARGLRNQILAVEEEAAKLQFEGAKARKKLEQERLALLKESPKKRREIQQKEAALIQQAVLAEAEAQKGSLEAQQRAAIFATEKRLREIRAMTDISAGAKAIAEEAEQTKLNATLLRLEKEQQAKLKAKREKAAQERRARAQREEAERRRALMEAYQLRLLEIEQIRINGAEAEEILELRLEAELKLVEDNATRRQMVNIKYENERLKLQQDKDAKAEAERQRLEDHRRSFLLESQAFDISMMEEGQDKELNLLELKYQRQREMKERSEEELTELSRRYNIERAAIVEKYEGQAMKAVLDSFMVLGERLRDQTGSLIFKQLTDESSEESRRQLEQTYREDVRRAKESAAEVEGSYKERVAAVDKANKEINDLTRTYQEERQKISEQEKSQLPNAIGQVLLALGEQAAVESLMFAAKAVAAGFAGSAKLAAGYGKASLIMAGAAVTAGITGKSLTSSGGGGGGGGGGGVSPLGTPQIAPEPEREQAESSQMTFNINFGGAVIYDTKQAAELALADRITNLQNTNRRGAPRRRF